MKFEENTKIKQEVKDALKKMNIFNATEIQEKCIPLIMEGKDIVGQSLTGSGKTAAFAIPIINKTINQNTSVLVLTPTRELAVQVSEAFSNISTFLKLNIVTIYGGVDIRPQINKLKTANIVIATPGRLLDHINRRTINLNEVDTLILDEADQMFDMGFVHDIEKIISNLPKKRQTLLFSATFSQKINSLIKKHLTNPIFIKAQEFVDESKLTQTYYNVLLEKRFSLLAHLLKNDDKDLSIVFCNKRYEVDKVRNNLKKQGVKGVAIHGGLTQSKRQLALQLLKKEHANVLVATDVAARGLDISGVSHVYNFGIPKNSEEYTHRIGRTARMGRDGKAISIVTERDRKDFTEILKHHKILREETPEFESVKFEKNLPSDDFSELRERDFGRRRNFRDNRSRNRGRDFGRRRNESRNNLDGQNKKFNRKRTRNDFNQENNETGFSRLNNNKDNNRNSNNRNSNNRNSNNRNSNNRNSNNRNSNNRNNNNRNNNNRNNSRDDFSRKPKFNSNSNDKPKDFNKNKSKFKNKRRNSSRDAFTDVSKNKKHFSAKKDFHKKIKQFKKTNHKKD